MKPCEAVIKFQKDYGNEKPQIYENKCCLMSPHEGVKHYSPTLLLTIGGDRVNEDIDGNNISKTWSPYPGEQKGK